MLKKSLFNKMQIVEKDGDVYAVVYEVKAYKGLERVVTIGLFFSKDEAEKTKESYYRAEIYDVVYIVENMVRF